MKELRRRALPGCAAVHSFSNNFPPFPPSSSILFSLVSIISRKVMWKGIGLKYGFADKFPGVRVQDRCMSIECSAIRSPV